MDGFARVTFSITPRLISSFNRVLKKRRSVLVGFLNPFGFVNMMRKGKVRETHEGYYQVFSYVRMIGGVQKQLGNPTTKYVEVRQVERVNRSKIDSLFGFSYLFSVVDGCGVFLFVTFFANTPPHRAVVIEVFENTEVPSDTCPGQLDSATESDQRVSTFRWNRPYTRSISWSCLIK